MRVPSSSFVETACVSLGIIALCAITMCGCLPSVEEIADECQSVLNEERPKIVAEIREECEALIDIAVDSAVDDISEFCSSEISAVKDWCAEQVDAVLEYSVSEALEEIGCIKDDTAPLGWTCHDSKLCPGVLP